MVVVQLARGKITGNVLYFPVNRYSSVLLRNVNWGTAWFHASEKDEIIKQLKEYHGEKLSSKWYHRQRSIEPNFILDPELYELI